MTAQLTHLTLPEGSVVRSSRHEVKRDILEMLQRWLPDKLGTGKYVPLPTPGLESFAVRAFGEEEGFLATIAGIRMPQPGDPAGQSLLMPLISFAAASTTRGANKVWPIITAMAMVPAPPAPALPWCVEVQHDTLATYPTPTGWCHDFERCVAWAWFGIVEPGTH